MAMIDFEGFGSVSTPAELVTYGKWLSVNGAGGIAVGRLPGSHCTSSFFGGGGENWSDKLIPPTATLFMGFAFQTIAIPSAAPIGVVNLYDDRIGQHLHLNLSYQTDGTLLVYWGGNSQTGGVLRLTTSARIFAGRWHYLELGASISPTAGWIEVRLDSVLVGTYYGSTGTSRSTANGITRSSASTTSSVGWVQVGWVNPSSSSSGHSFTDMVWMNDTIVDALMPNNDFIGDVRVPWCPPTGPGAHTDFAIGGASPAATNWQATDQIPAPGDVSFVSSSTVGAIDTYAMADLPTGTQTVYAIRPQAIMRKSDAGPRTAAPLVRWAAGGPLDIPLGSGMPLQTSYGIVSGILEVRPDGSPWSATDVNALEIGATVSS